MKPIANIRKAVAGETLTRWVKLPGRHEKSRNNRRAPIGHDRTLWPRQIQPAAPGVLVSGHSNTKIGRDVRKGRFKGYWIYSLSLEERATCPLSCLHYRSCYGNSMPFGKRVDHRDHGALCAAIETDIERLLSVRGRKGILIRLHALGDFYGVPYVEFWRSMLAKHPRLAVWGYTARVSCEIGHAIADVKRAFPDRFRIRWSDGGMERDCTVSVDSESDCPAGAFVCPEQTDKALACATCGACWTGNRNVAFINH